jgi:hypothetical protein
VDYWGEETEKAPSSSERRKKIEKIQSDARNNVTGQFQYCFDRVEICEEANLALLGTTKTSQMKKIQRNIKTPNLYIPPPDVRIAMKRDHSRAFIKDFMNISCECCPSGQGEGEPDVKVMFIAKIYKIDTLY